GNGKTTRETERCSLQKGSCTFLSEFQPVVDVSVSIELPAVHKSQGCVELAGCDVIWAAGKDHGLGSAILKRLHDLQKLQHGLASIAASLVSAIDHHPCQVKHGLVVFGVLFIRGLENGEHKAYHLPMGVDGIG